MISRQRKRCTFWISLTGWCTFWISYLKITPKMYLFARVCHLWNNFCIPSKSYSFFTRKPHSCALFRTFEFFSKVLFFCETAKNEQKYFQIGLCYKKIGKGACSGTWTKIHETRIVEPFLEFSQKSVLLVLLQIFAKIGAQEGTWTLQTRINTCFFKIVQAPVVELFILLSIENGAMRRLGSYFLHWNRLSKCWKIQQNKEY